MSVLKTIKFFTEAINSADIEKLAELMTKNHTFIDADGSEYYGSDKMREGWSNYFSMVPDFKIKIRESFERNNTLILIGTAEGTFIEKGKLKTENHWKVPAAWRGIVKNDKVSTWQLFCNQEPIIKIYNRINRV